MKLVERIRKFFCGDKKNTIMCRAGGYAHKNNIQRSLLIMMILGITIGGASKEIINPIIVLIVGDIKANAALLMNLSVIIDVTGAIFFISAVAIVIGVIGFLFGGIFGGVIGVYIGGVIGDVISGVISSVIDGDIDGAREQLFVGGLLITLGVAIMMSITYYKRYRDYLEELAVADELYKVRCQQWRIFHNLKSGKGNSWFFCLRQQWRIFRGLKSGKGKSWFFCLRQQWRIFRGLKSGKEKSWFFCLRQQWRICHGLKSGERNSWFFCLRQQWRIFRSLKDDGDIDHIIVCEKGVFCVETKTRRKDIKTDGEIVFEKDQFYIHEKSINEKESLECLITRVKQNASWLQKEINKKICEPKEEKFVIPILTCPGWSTNKVFFNGKIVLCNPKQELDIVLCNPKQKLDIVLCNPKLISEILKTGGDILCDCEVNEICNFLEEATQTKIFDNR